MIKKIVVAGCRDYTDYESAKPKLDEIIAPIASEHTVVIISGDCRGADKLGERYALENGFRIERHPADWDRHGRAAGPIRNREMAKVADYVICFWDGKSRGTKTMIDYAKAEEKERYIILI